MEPKDQPKSLPLLSRKAVGVFLIMIGGILGLGQKLIYATPSWIAGAVSKNETLQINQRIDRALTSLLGIPMANADVPGSCNSCSCTSVDPGCGCCACAPVG